MTTVAIVNDGREIGQVAWDGDRVVMTPAARALIESGVIVVAEGGTVLAPDSEEYVERLPVCLAGSRVWAEERREGARAGYDPNQPRDPGGEGGGQWVAAGASGADVRPSEQAVYNASSLWQHKNVEARAQANGMTAAEYKAAVDAHLAEQLFDAEVKIRTPLELVDEIAADERFKSQFESGTSGGMLNPPTRATAEAGMFGYPKDLPPEQRPIYGYLHRPSKDEGRVDQYGEVTWELKRGATRERVTWTSQDSLGTFLVPSKLTEPSHLSIRPPDHPFDDETLVWDPATDPLEAVDSQYREAQIHGGVTLDDVAAVTVPEDMRGAVESGPLGMTENLGLELHPNDPVWSYYEDFHKAMQKLKARGITVEYQPR